MALRAACARAAACSAPYATHCRMLATAAAQQPAGVVSSSSWLGRGLLLGLAGAAAAASCSAAEVPPSPTAGPAAAPATEPREQDLWDKWAAVKAFLTRWREHRHEPEPLPVDKLKCHMPKGGYSPESYRPVVLVSCGSFNPPTHMHLRMLELAQQALTKTGHDVLGCYLSPVNDAYWKKGLAPGSQRLAMCRLATAGSDSIMVDGWEVRQRRYTRTLHVLRHISEELRALGAAGVAPRPDQVEPAGTTCPEGDPRVMLVCGADVVASMADPGIWRQDLLEELLSQHGVVCIARAGTDLSQLFTVPGSLLERYQGNVVVLHDPVPNDISSSRVRHELQAGHSVRYLIPDSVLAYVYDQGLYGTAPAHRPRWLAAALPSTQAPIWVFDPQLSVFVCAGDLATPPGLPDECAAGD